MAAVLGVGALLVGGAALATGLVVVVAVLTHEGPPEALPTVAPAPAPIAAPVPAPAPNPGPWPLRPLRLSGRVPEEPPPPEGRFVAAGNIPNRGCRAAATGATPGSGAGGGAGIWADFGAGYEAMGQAAIADRGSVTLRCSRLRHNCLPGGDP